MPWWKCTGLIRRALLVAEGDHLVAGSADKSGADERLRIDIGGAEEFAAVGLDPHRFAGPELLQRRHLGIDFVAVNPQMPALQTSLLVTLEA